MSTNKRKHKQDVDLGAKSLGGNPCKRPGQKGNGDNRSSAEQRLVMRCLAGEELAWEQLYRQWDPPLVEAIKLLVRADAKDAHLVEELAARVWYALLRNRARLLARYDPERDSSLGAFLMGLARIEWMRHRRAERRRRSHEVSGGLRALEEPRTSDWEVSAMIREFALTLTPGEKDFMEDYLTTPQEDQEDRQQNSKLSPTNIWQRRHRLRMKLEAFLENT